MNSIYIICEKTGQEELYTLYACENDDNHERPLSEQNRHVVMLTFFRHYKRSGALMYSERTMHLWYKYYGLFVRIYITSLQSYLLQINTRQTSFEVCFDSKCKTGDCSAP